MSDITTLQSDELIATVASKGAELVSLRTRSGIELMWQAGPEWPRHAPILFPIVGRLNDDALRVNSRSYRMSQHGFARDLFFELVERSSDGCVFNLRDSKETRASYPFSFDLRVSFHLGGPKLDVKIDVTNTGDVTLPFSLGAHPALNWPLDRSLSKRDYWLEFESAEVAPIKRLMDGLLQNASHPTPIRAKRLDLSENLFAQDAMILEGVVSRSVRYRASRGPRIDVSWNGFTDLGLWSKPTRASFLCIEPWHGTASPIGFDGPFRDKPGLIHMGVGDTQHFSFSIGYKLDEIGHE